MSLVYLLRPGLQDLQDRSLEADVVLHNAVVSGCDTREPCGLIFFARNKVASISLCPKAAWHMAMDQLRQWKKSSSIFSKLRCRSIQASLISFNTFISTCDKSGHWEAQLNVRDQKSIADTSALRNNSFFLAPTITRTTATTAETAITATATTTTAAVAGLVMARSLLTLLLRLLPQRFLRLL